MCGTTQQYGVLILTIALSRLSLSIRRMTCRAANKPAVCITANLVVVWRDSDAVVWRNVYGATNAVAYSPTTDNAALGDMAHYQC